MLKAKPFMLSAICVAVLGLTACGEDTNYVIDPAQQELIDEQQKEIDELKKNQGAGNVDTFQEQCATIGVEFEYEQEGGGDFIAAATTTETADCVSCHAADNTVGAPTNHGMGDNCANCHDNPHVDDAPIEGDPTEPTFPQPEWTGTTVAIDGKTGASGPTYYTAGSYLNADYLVAQGKVSVVRYNWTAPEEDSVSYDSLAAACEAPERQNVKALFPGEENQSYSLVKSSNSIAAKTVSTVSLWDQEFNRIETPYPNVATFGFAIKKDEEATELSERYSTDMTINLNNTCHNAIMNGDARAEWYEYDPTQSVKTSLETAARNRGARILLTTNYEKSVLLDATFSPIVTGEAGMTGDEFRQAYKDNVDAAKWCQVHFKVENIIPLG
ncbi:hypothetical protein [Shewanella youngdeokensis]|uniref:Cytochrome c domain-containing protein n=1 Tax=Shewanella youngdeokensis TaxID=2999068 RepID=A0ABZ0JZ08_9GAMM|nr:hypothetical protein RGE70_00800 [Shewanella sp. DAU334]